LGKFKERRRARRAKVTIEIPGLGEAQDVSSDGMCLLVENPFAVGKLVDLEFRPLPESALIKCKGEIIWQRLMADGRIQVGLKFVWPNGPKK